MLSRLERVLLVALVLGGAGSLNARTLTVGVLEDGPAARSIISADTLAAQATAVLGDPSAITFPQRLRIDGGWTVAGIERALDRLESNPAVDVVVTLGFISSHIAGQRQSFPKPTIAALVVDPVLQGFPIAGGKSGRDNFTYVAAFHSVADEIRTLRRVTGFRHLAVLVDRLSLAGVPQLRAKADELLAELGGTAVLVPADSVQEAVQAIPADADAAYVAPLLRLQDEDLDRLAAALVARRLPSLSRIGRRELEHGLLMSTSAGGEDTERLARRIVLDIDRIGQGENAASIELAFTTEQRLVFNMRTARAIGFSPHWDDLADAVLMYAEEPNALEPLTLLEAMQATLRQSPSLAASAIAAQAAADQVRRSRADLLPSLELSAARTRIDADRASPLLQAENTAAIGGSLRQALYSDRLWAALAIAGRQQGAAEADHRTAMLDALDQTAVAYLDVLRAKSVESVRRQNVENTRKNLEIARVREAVGLGGHSDYLRWIAQVAGAKQDVLTAQAARAQAEVELARIMHRDPAAPFATVEGGLDDPLAIVADPRTQRYIDTPAKWGVFRSFTVKHALDRSPELARIDELIAGQDRAVTSARRAFFLPDLSLAGTSSDAISRSGAGSAPTPGAPNEESWSVSLQATLPLFTGGAQLAEFSSAKHQLRRLQAERAATEDAVRARALAALERIGASNASIGLSREAASAARENFASVTEAYSRGLVSVTDLIDAQSASLNAELAEAQAKYTFLIDFMDVLRAAGSFELLLDRAYRAAWYDEVDRWFRDHPPGSPAASQ